MRKKTTKDANLEAPIRKQENSSATLEVPTQPTKKVTLNATVTKWRDASFRNDGYYSKKELSAHKPITCFTCGFIIYQDEQKTIIAMTYHKELNEYEKILVIPTSLIID